MTPERLDAACARALVLGTRSYSSVAAILKNAQETKASQSEQPSLFHENIVAPATTIERRDLMLIHPLAERLRALGMAAMADAFLEMQNHAAATELTREDWLGLLNHHLGFEGGILY